VTPPPEEIAAGRKAYRQIEAYKKRQQGIKRAYGLDVVLGSLLALSFLARGSGWAALGILLAWFLPTILFEWLRKRDFKKDSATMEDLRRKYGSSVDFSN
jgi:hypothetical protein